jgi:allantoate deiminase
MTTSDQGAAARSMARLDQLATFSSEDGAITRLFLSPAHREAATLVAGWMQEGGMSASIDAVGNVVGRSPGTSPGAGTLILGSHIDTVRNAGRYDGCLGVVLAIEAVARLREAGEQPPFAIEVIAFGDEEGVRFPEALAGSRAVAGCFDAAVLDVVDQQGVALRDALKTFGCDPAAIPALARSPAEVLGYLEVHIEQGPVLEAEDLPVGVVTAIAGASRIKIEVSGMAGHAGTVPMGLRRDAFAAMAEMATALEALALETPGLVATIGRVKVLPGAVNVIPGRADFTVDIRSPDDAVRKAAIARMEQRFSAIALRRGVALRLEPFYAEAAAPCAEVFRTGLARAIRKRGLRALELPSGAGHDGLAMIGLCPIGMLFVRCAGGISHNPAEAITAEDAAVALDVLVDTLRHFPTADP